MKQSIKKIIAKEFLYFLLVIVICVITLMGTCFSNLLQESKLSDAIKEIEKNQNLSINYKDKLQKRIENQIIFIQKYTKEFDINAKVDESSARDAWKKLQHYVETDSIKYKWEKVWTNELINFQKKVGLGSPEKFSQFIKENSITKTDSLKLDFYRTEIHSLKLKTTIAINKQFSKKEQIDLTLQVLYLSVFIIFGIRYLYLGFRWSKNVLKEK